MAPAPRWMRLDANGAAGVLREVFAVEMTVGLLTCGTCGRVSMVGALHLYGGAMGTVLRCPGCESVVLRITGVPTGHVMELRGILHVQTGRTELAEPGPDATLSSPG